MAMLVASTFVGTLVIPTLVLAQTTATPIEGATTVAAEDTPSAETLAWEAALQSDDPEDMFAFIEAYPNGSYIKDAKLRIIDLLWVDLEEDSPTSAAIVEETAVADIDTVSEEPAIITALPTGDIELRSADGLVSVEGIIIAFDDTLITVKTSFGTVGIENDGIGCIGATCPTALLATP